MRLRNLLLGGLIGCSAVSVLAAGTASWYAYQRSMDSIYGQEIWLHFSPALSKLEGREYSVEHPITFTSPPADQVPMHFLFVHPQSLEPMAISEWFDIEDYPQIGPVVHGQRSEIVLNGRPMRLLAVALSEEQMRAPPLGAGGGAGRPPPPRDGAPPPRLPGIRPEVIVDGPRPLGQLPRQITVIGEELLSQPLPEQPVAIAILLIDLSRLKREQADILITIVAIGLGAMLVASGLAWLILQRLLGPIERIDRAILDSDPEAGGLGVAPGEVPEELQPIVVRLDELMARVAADMARERRITADIAHELRTPLAALRSGLSFTLLEHGDDPQLAESDAMVAALEARIDALLMLARLSNSIDGPKQGVRLDELLDTAWHSLLDHADERGITLDRRAGEVVLFGQRDLLDILVANALGNAVSYADLDGTLTVAAGCDGDDCHLSFRNPAGDLQPGDYDEAFTPLWRGDTARQGTERHAGLGLSMVARIAQAHGGHASARVDQDRHFVLEIRLPVASCEGCG